MTDDDGPARRWSVPSWRRFAEFVLTIAQLERSYQSLKSDNEKLKQRVTVLEEKLTDQGGQLKILGGFVQRALEQRIDDRTDEADRRIQAKTDEAFRQVELKAEQAVARHVEQIIARRSLPPDGDP